MVMIYFSRPINRLDYVGMKFVSAFLPMVAIIVVTLLLYYGVDLVTLGEGWSYVIDTSPVLLSGCVCGILVAFTYTCLGLGFSSVSRNRFVSAISLMAVFARHEGVGLHGRRTLRAEFPLRILPIRLHGAHRAGPDGLGPGGRSSRSMVDHVLDRDERSLSTWSLFVSPRWR